MTLSHAIKNISRYRRRYGIGKGFNACLHYLAVATKKRKINPQKNLLQINGSQLEVIPGDKGTSLELLLFNTHEPISTKIVSKLLQPGMVCLDIGANIGYYVSLENSIVGKSGKIIAIEPSPENFEYLTKNTKRLKIDNVDLFNIAAGNESGVLNFLMYEGESNSGQIISEDEAKKYSQNVIKVPVKPIDMLIEELGLTKLDFLRMDVEGYEYHILQGMKKTLEKFHPIIQIEVHRGIMGNQDTKTFFTILQDLGYEINSYVPREIDTPMIGSIHDVEYFSMSELFEKLEHKELPSFFMVSLKNQ